jgi:hypothetical protein
MAQSRQQPTQTKLNELTPVKFVQFQVVSLPPQVILYALDSQGQIWRNLNPSSDLNWVPLSTPIQSQLQSEFEQQARQAL